MSSATEQYPDDTAIIIPARYASSRLPGKPLALIAGKTMLERVWSNASRAIANSSRVFIATDDPRIQEAAEKFGAAVIMTPVSCSNGSERVHVASATLPNSIKFFINLQGDSPLTPPAIINELVAARRASKADIVTVAIPLPLPERKRIRLEQKWGAGTYVVCDHSDNALYFSRYPVPFVRDHDADAPLLKHVGIYAYTRDSLAQYLSLPASDLEQAESLEQLRALKAGMRIAVKRCDLGGRTLVSVDTPEDLIRAEAVIASEGELLA